MNKEDLCYTPATVLLVMIRAKEISPVELMDAVIERADALEDRLHRTSRVDRQQAPPGGAFETDESDGRARSKQSGIPEKAPAPN